MNFTQKAQGGFVSVLTVIFFMLLVSVISVSFLRIMLNDQQQTLDDDLSKGAYSAAQAGVEDAKRALIKCRNNPFASGCGTLYNPDCPGFFGTNQAAFGLTASGTGVQVGDASLNERYTCAIIQRETESVVQDQVPANQSDLIELKGVSPFNTVKISWDVAANNPTAQLPGVSDTAQQIQNGNPRFSQWNSNWPAMLRMMFISHPGTTITADNTISTSYFAIPASSGVTGFRLGSSPRQRITCDTTRPTNYTCVATVTGFAPANSYYVVVQPLYRRTTYKIQLYQGTTKVNLDGVAPIIDSTGAASNVYRRVQAQVKLGGSGLISSEAVDSTGLLCKNFLVTSDPNDFTENCASN